MQRVHIHAPNACLTMQQANVLRAFCSRYGQGYELRLSSSPPTAPGAIGMRGATSCAQLCEGNVVEMCPSLDGLHSLAHEIGHAEVARIHGPEKFNDEQLVAVEQIAFLVNLAKALLTGGQLELGRVAAE